MSLPWMARLRRAVLARPGFTSLPLCAGCQRPTGAVYLNRDGVCQGCEIERDLEWRTRQANSMWPDGSPKVERPVDDAFDSDKPFLLEEE